MVSTPAANHRSLARPLLAVLLAANAGAQTDPEQESTDPIARARDIHRRVVTLDTHKDISPLLARQDMPSDPEARRRFREEHDPSYRGNQQVDFPKMREGGLDVAFFIVYVGQGALSAQGFERAHREALDKFAAIHRMCKVFPDDIELALTAGDVERIAGAGKLVCCIGIENGYPMGEDLSRIARFHELGARYMGIAHNRHSQLGDSHTPAEPLHGGLSELGRKAIAEMNRVGIMVDVSHASKAAMLQAVAASKAPVIASHSGAAALRAHGRNLDDEQLRALQKNGGVIQVVALGSFLKDDGERRAAQQELRQELGLPDPRDLRRRNRDGVAPESDAEFERKLALYQERLKEIDRRLPPADVSTLADHIDHVVKTIGIDHVGISTDFDGGGGIVGFNDASETFNVTLELVRRGYTEAQIGKIWSGNTLRLWREVEQFASKLRKQGGD